MFLRIGLKCYVEGPEWLCGRRGVVMGKARSGYVGGAERLGVNCGVDCGGDGLLADEFAVVAFGGDEYPVEVIAAAKVEGVEFFGELAANDNETLDVCLDCHVDDLVIILKDKTVDFVVHVVGLEGQDYIVIALKLLKQVEFVGLWPVRVSKARCAAKIPVPQYLRHKHRRCALIRP